LERDVKQLLAAPADDELDVLICQELQLIGKLQPRVLECQQVQELAAQNGQSALEVQQAKLAAAKEELKYYRKEWKSRKLVVQEFLDKVFESKGCSKGSSGRKDLLEKIGIELDE
jgi:hypothetical protein